MTPCTEPLVLRSTAPRTAGRLTLVSPQFITSPPRGTRSILMTPTHRSVRPSRLNTPSAARRRYFRVKSPATDRLSRMTLFIQGIYPGKQPIWWGRKKGKEKGSADDVRHSLKG